MGRRSPEKRKRASRDGKCFVIMPFGQPFDRYYDNVFAPAVIDAGLEPFRADSLFTSTQIIDDIWRLTRGATLLIADLTGKNPNVFYELGLAHAIGKPVVLVANSIDDIPFDLRALRVIIYDKANEAWGKALRADLTRALKETLVNIAGAVPLPFIERSGVEIPKEDPVAYEIRRLWDEIRAMRVHQTAGTSSAVPAVASDLAQYADEFRAQMTTSGMSDIDDVTLRRALALVLASKYIDAVKIIRENANCSLADAKKLMDRIRGIVERSAT